MKEREKVVVTGLVVLMLLTWLGFAFHRSPDFAGSLWGGVLGVSGALLMLFPLLYLFIKRIAPLKRVVTRYIPIPTLLRWHIYAGIIGPILVILHSGHKFESALGIALTGMTLIVVVSGFIGRYLMSFISGEIRERKQALMELRREYDLLAAGGAGLNTLSPSGSTLRAVRSRLRSWLAPEVDPNAAKTLRLVDSIADLEYSIASNQKFKKAFGLWLKFHIVISLVLYVLLGLHVWAAIHFGLRWFS